MKNENRKEIRMNEQEMVKVAIRSKSGIVWIKTQEEIRVRNLIIAIADSLKYKVYTWTVTKGLTEFDPTQERSDSSTQDLSVALDTLFSRDGRALSVFFDAGNWLTNDPIALRSAKDYHQKIAGLDKENSKQVVFVSNDDAPEISGITTINWSPPNAEQLGELLDNFLEFCSAEARDDVEKNGNRKSIIDAMLGLNSII